MARILVAGTGSIGKRHIRNLLSLGEKDISLLHSRPGNLPEFPELPVFCNRDEAFEAQPELTLVCTPTAHHIGIATAAAECGSHLFIEKPLSHAWDGVEQLLELIESRQLISMVGFDLRFDPGLLKVEEIIRQGRVGRVVAVQAQVGQYLPEWRPWEDYRQGVSARRESGGGVILDLIHELDYLTWLLGPVRKVQCFAEHVSRLEIETEDVAAITLQFTSGAIGSVHLDYVQRVPSRTCRIIAEEGTIICDLLEREVNWYEASDDKWHSFVYRNFERNDRFVAEMRHLLACLDRRESPPVDAHGGVKVLKLALSAKKSAEQGMAVQL